MRTSSPLRLVAFSVFFTAAAACGSSSDQGSTMGRGNNSSPAGSNVPTGAKLTIDQYCAARANLDSAWCTYVSKCCSDADKKDVLFGPPGCAFGPTDPADCTKRLTTQTGDGSMVFHGEYAQSCVDELKKWVPDAPSSCSGVHLSDHATTGHARPEFAQIDACRATEAGQKKNGDACAYDTQCSEGLRCRSYLGSPTDFRCQPLSHFHEPCGLSSDCDKGLSCIGKTGAATCDVLHGVGQECIFASDCQDGLLCGGETCVEPPKAGQSCTSTNGYACEPLLGCRLSDHTCVSLAPDGVACTSSSQCEGRCDTSNGAGKCVSICGGTW